MSRAIVLSGGGARGAYEAGVLSFVFGELAKRLGRPVRPDLILGSSVGAIHACYLAATAHLGPERVRRLASTWHEMRLEELLLASPREILNLPRRIVSLLRTPAALRGEQLPDKLYGLLDTQRLEKLVVEAIPWRGVRRNLAAGHVSALCVVATQIATGRVAVFVQRQEGVEVRPFEDPSVVAKSVGIGPVHALASAAIPVLFPPVRVGHTFYADGSLRMNTPLAPALHLGADRVLVVGLRSRAPTGDAARLAERRVEGLGSPAFLYGKVLNALLLDHLDADLTRLRHVNSILRAGEKAFGPEFLEELNLAAGRQREHDAFRVIEELVIRPSDDLGELAVHALEEKRRLRPLASVWRLLLAGLPAQGDLLSYLLFDSCYTAELLELGYRDARAEQERLAAFFSDPP